MPSIVLHPRRGEQEFPLSAQEQALPPLLQTPLGLALIEVQGSLNLTAPREGEDLTDLGRLEFPLLSSVDDDAASREGPWTKKIYFYVGQHQRLAGELVKLPKPFAVLRRRECSDAVQELNGSVEEVEIAEIIRWKLFFGGRPEFV